MNTPTHTPTAQDEAAGIINSALEGLKEKGQLSPQAIRQQLEQYRKGARSQTAKLLGTYVDGLDTIQEEIPDAKVEDLPDSIGGQFDGARVTIAEETLNVRGDIQRTVTAMEETARHEAYHEEHEHTKPMTVAQGKEGDVIVTIGGRDFTQTELIEGMTVHKTGNETVSDDYRSMEQDLVSAASAEGIDMNEVEAAIDTHDVSVLDDDAPETSEVEAKDTQFAIAA